MSYWVLIGPISEYNPYPESNPAMVRAGDAKGTIELISLYLNMYWIQTGAKYTIAIKYIRDQFRGEVWRGEIITNLDCKFAFMKKERNFSRFNIFFEADFTC